MNKNDKIHLLVLIAITVVVIFLFKLYKDGVIKPPSTDESQLERIVQPSKINKYFGNTSDEDIDRVAYPDSN